MEKEIKIDIKTEHIQALLEGKKMVYKIEGLPIIILYPERYGVFMTHDKFQKIRRELMGNMITNPEKMMKEFFGEEVYEKFIKK